jgi:glycosyltransferase involved in cell wall biosynthesis
VCISKDEGPNLKEWLEYHLLVGVTKFYFYDNESTDNTREILHPYIDRGIVDYTYFPGKGRQLDAYNDAIQRHKQECRWMSFTDIDEYLSPTEPFKSVATIMNEQTAKYGGGAAGILVCWCIYGSSHLKSTPKGLCTENFTMRAEESFWDNSRGKTICNPRMVNYYVSPHYPYYKLGAHSIDASATRPILDWFVKPVDWSILRINHYAVKSYEQWLLKIKRGVADKEREGRRFFEFEVQDKNDVEDKSMLVYKEKLYTACL